MPTTTTAAEKAFAEPPTRRAPKKTAKSSPPTAVAALPVPRANALCVGTPETEQASGPVDPAPKRTPGRAWLQTTSNLVERNRATLRRQRTAEEEGAAANGLEVDSGKQAERALGLSRMVETFGEGMNLPYMPEKRKRPKVFGPEVDMRAVMVRRLIVDGFKVEDAGTVASLAEAHRKGRLRANGKRKVGRKPKGPRLFNKKRVYDDGSVKHFCYIKYYDDRRSAEIELAEDENPADRLDAIYELALYVEEKVREALNWVLTNDITMARIYEEFLDENKPGSRAGALDQDNYDRAKAALDIAKVWNGQAGWDTIGLNTAKQYIQMRIAQEKKRQSCDAEETEYVGEVTALGESSYVVMAIDWFCREYDLTPKIIDRPKVRGTGYKYIPFSWVNRLLRACRGRMFDAAGRVIGCHRFPERYAAVERAIWLYLYSGTRFGNLPDILWHWDMHAGHVSTWLGKLIRQGQWSQVTRKRRGQSFLPGSLEELLPQWESDDRIKRKEKNSDVLFQNVLHDEEGLPLAEGRLGVLFREVRELAGLPRVTMHMLKHAGVTMCTHAGMSRNMISNNYSTSHETLIRYYTHLNEEWDEPKRDFDPADLKFFELRNFSERPKRPTIVADAA
ncbi:hypothetical protein XI07_13905 [Bradyrhizobium sp. CCBAU 11445]|uniref:hypothetical protein n=1 Tax=Bradyrhizobium sp. CCBAU 11445 TaxID=1630896 RepID=UPI002304F157|nr:hypothetical protein [Bradyrhizobium sp. CCBAU 11445]MDA9483099.1 hypothetical protein [Bradyrhizobium sp. CCBAU 11445]